MVEEVVSATHPSALLQSIHAQALPAERQGDGCTPVFALSIQIDHYESKRLSDFFNNFLRKNAEDESQSGIAGGERCATPAMIELWRMLFEIFRRSRLTRYLHLREARRDAL